MTLTRMALLVLLGLFVIAGTVEAAPTLDEWRDYQDQLLLAGERDRLLKEFRDRVAKEETALNRYLLGRALGKIGDLPNARAEFTRALELNPVYAPASQGLALCLVGAGEIPAAVEELRRSIRLDPADMRSQVLLAGLLADTGNVAESEALLRGILEKDPKVVDARFLLARILLQTKRWEKARSEFEAVLYLQPGHHAARKGLAVVHLQTQKWDKAEVELRRLVADEPRDLEARMMLATTLAQSGNFEEAREILEEMSKIEGLSEEAKKQIQAELKRAELVEKGQDRPRNMGDLVLKQIERLESKDVEERRKAMRLLSQLVFPQLPRPIVRCITDEDEQVRLIVVRMIGDTREELSVPLLDLKLHSKKDADESARVRGAVVTALRKIPSAACVPVLLRALEDESSYVRELVVRSLRLRCGPRFSDYAPGRAVAEQMDQVRQGWWRWWKSASADREKLNTIEALDRVLEKSPSGSMLSYVVPLMEDPNPKIFDAAYALFTKRTGESYGKGDDAEARVRIAREARAHLEGKNR